MAPRTGTDRRTSGFTGIPQDIGDEIAEHWVNMIEYWIENCPSRSWYFEKMNCYFVSKVLKEETIFSMDTTHSKRRVF
jgi:hypothetical protein